MPQIEQAVLLVRTTQHARKAEFTACSPDLHPLDRMEMLDWFTDESFQASPISDTPNIFFHPLPSGRFVIARTVPRRDTVFSLFSFSSSFYVHLMAVPREILLQFANNPLRIDRLLEERNAWLPPNRRPKAMQEMMQPIKIEEGGPMIDHDLLEELVDRYGADLLARLLQSSFDAVSTFFITDRIPSEVIEGVLSLLPIPWRLEVTFSTGFHFSPQCPVKLVGCKTLFKNEDASPVFQLRDDTPHRFANGLVLEPWPLFVCQVLRRKAFPVLEACLIEDFLEKDPGVPSPPFETVGRERMGEGFSREYRDEAECEGGGVSWEEPDIDRIGALGNACLDRLFDGRFSFPDALVESTAEANRECAPSVPPGLVAGSLPIAVTDYFAEPNGFFADPVAHANDTIPETTPSFSVAEHPVVLEKSAHAAEPTMPAPDSWKRNRRCLNISGQELQEIDSFTTRALFGDESAREQLRIRWKKLVSRLSWHDRHELCFEYVELIKTVMVQPLPISGSKEPRRSLDALEVLDIFLDDAESRYTEGR